MYVFQKSYFYIFPIRKIIFLCLSKEKDNVSTYFQKERSYFYAFPKRKILFLRFSKEKDRISTFFRKERSYFQKEISHCPQVCKRKDHISTSFQKETSYFYVFPKRKIIILRFSERKDRISQIGRSYFCGHKMDISYFLVFRKDHISEISKVNLLNIPAN